MVIAMVSHPRLRSALTTLCLYALAALLIGYFGVNAYTGNHGLKARHDLDQQIAALTTELNVVKAERERWQRRIALLKPDRIDPDMLDERARALLGVVDSRDAVMLIQAPRRPVPATAF
jgi:cell division protein FtsB